MTVQLETWMGAQLHIQLDRWTVAAPDRWMAVHPDGQLHIQPDTQMSGWLGAWWV